MYYINFIEARYRSGKSNRGQPNSVKLLRQFLLPSAIALMIGACGSDDPSQLTGGRDRHIQPVELVLTELGRPIPALLAEEQILHRDNGEELQTLDPH